jgi:lipocalin
MKFVEIFLYISIACENYLDLLYVGIKEDRSKVLRKLTLETLTKNDTFFIILKKGFFRKRFKILTFDDKNGILILSDKKMKYLSIFSRKPTLSHETVENYLKQIKDVDGEIELFSNSIV